MASWNKIINNGVYHKKKKKKKKNSYRPKTKQEIDALIASDESLKKTIDAELNKPTTERLKTIFKYKRKKNTKLDNRKWRDVRYQALVKYGKKCMACNATNKPLHVDHIKPKSKYPELMYDLDNLQILCEDCNIGKWNRDETDWRDK